MKMSSLIMASAVLFFVQHSGAATGFSSGNVFEHVNVYGSVTMQCPSRSGDGSQVTAFFRCSGDRLNPNETAYFVTDEAVAADHVYLTAIHADGSKREKNDLFSSAKRRSNSRFNLWISTVFQRPLLDFGTSRILYKLTKNGSVAKEGEFVAEVRQGKDVLCRNEYLFSSDSTDCLNSGYACSKYFNQVHDCQ